MCSINLSYLRLCPLGGVSLTFYKQSRGRWESAKPECRVNATFRQLSHERIKYSAWGVYSPEPRAEVYCLQLSFKISKLAYYYKAPPANFRAPMPVYCVQTRSQFLSCTNFSSCMTSASQSTLWCIKGTKGCSLEVDSSVPLTHHNPKDLFSKETQNLFSDSFRF